MALKHRLPAMYPFPRYPQAGSLMSYGASTVGWAAPLSQPTSPSSRQPKFGLVINLNTAKALGLTIPQALLVRADQVIQ